MFINKFPTLLLNYIIQYNYTVFSIRSNNQHTYMLHNKYTTFVRQCPLQIISIDYYYQVEDSSYQNVAKY